MYPKICLVGSGASGKTSFVHACIEYPFRTVYVPTLGIEVHPLEIRGQSLILWDLAGQAKFGGLRSGYFTGANAFLLFVDVTNRESLEDATRWLEIIESIFSDPNVTLVANKIDRVDRVLSSEDIESYAIEKGLHWVEISVLEQRNMRDPWNWIVSCPTQEEY